MALCDQYYGKTFSHLAVALTIAATSAEYSDLGKSISVPSSPFLSFLLSLVISLILLFGVSWTSPGNPMKYVFFLLFAYWMGQVMKPFVNNLEANKLLVRVLLLTLGVFIGLTAVGFYDNQNTLGFGPYLLAALMGLIVTRLLIYTFATSEERAKAENWLSLIGVAIFSVFIVYDTQLIKANARICKSLLRSGRKPDYPAESLGLFLDFLNLFQNLGNLSD
jgi:FtsH-binding integral membrane protein